MSKFILAILLPAVLCVAQTVAMADAQTDVETGLKAESAGKLVEAKKWYYQAAMQGYAEGQLHLALVSADANERAMWLRKAADQGNAWAQYGLGTMYADGRGVPQNTNEALVWLNRSAAQGNKKAESKIESVMFEEKLRSGWRPKDDGRFYPIIDPVGCYHYAPVGGWSGVSPRMDSNGLINDANSNYWTRERKQPQATAVAAPPPLHFPTETAAEQLLRQLTSH